MNKTPAEKAEILKQGAVSAFWLLILEVLEESKRDIQEKQDSADIAELSAEEYKFRNELFKAKRELLNKLINTPENVISWLSKPEGQKAQDFDPYA